MPLLEVSDLTVRFDTPDGVLQAVDGIGFQVRAGETLAIVGESGAGKSQMVMSIMGLLARNGEAHGRALFRGQDLMQMTQRELNGIRGRHIAMIFQDPRTSLNPFLTIGKQMVEVAMHHQGLGRDEAHQHALEMLRAVRIAAPQERIAQYPHELSGGMRQRIMIAMALLCEPDLLIADEPTTALDVTVQAQITQLIGELREKADMAIILITHDMAVVAELCDRVVVMYAGEAVECGSAEDIFYRTHHPYTRGLLESVPRLDRPLDHELRAIPGNPPNMLDLPPGCRFRDRCAQATAQCAERPPVWATPGGHSVRCVLPLAGGSIQQPPQAADGSEEAA